MSPLEHLEAEIEKAHIEDSDIVLVKYPDFLPEETAERIRGIVKSAVDRLGVRAEVVVLGEGMSIDVIKTSQLPKDNAQPLMD